LKRDGIHPTIELLKESIKSCNKFETYVTKTINNMSGEQFYKKIFCHFNKAFALNLFDKKPKGIRALIRTRLIEVGNSAMLHHSILKEDNRSLTAFEDFALKYTIYCVKEVIIG
jgi:hypothetical protein